MGTHAGTCGAITTGDSVLDSSPRRYSHIYLTPGCVRYLFGILAARAASAPHGLALTSAGQKRAKLACRHEALAIEMTCLRTCQTSWFHIMQISTITYGCSSMWAVLLRPEIPRADRRSIGLEVRSPVRDWDPRI